jgi:3D (Asp-Asp-Asp) domain-containing protein
MKRTMPRFRINFSILKMVIGMLVLAGWQPPSFGQADNFAHYQLRVHCDPLVATVVFSVKGTGMMGMKVLCAGQCGGRGAAREVSFEEALAEVPARVSDAFKAKILDHVASSVARKERSIARCAPSKSAANNPPDTPAPPPDEKCSNVTIEVTRFSLVQTSSTGTPQPGARKPDFKYTASPSSAVTYTTSDPNAFPSIGDLKAAENSSKTGEPSPGALATLSVTYTCEDGQTATKEFTAAIFGLSCYVLADENDWILPAPRPSPTPSPTASPPPVPGPSPAGSPSPAPSPAGTPSPTPTPAPTLNCRSQRIGSSRYSGVTTDPPGLPAGDYCTAFLADVRLQGSGTTKDGTKVAYVSGGNPNWVFKTIEKFTGADLKELVENGSVARDRRIVGGRGETTVTLESGSFVANDTGGAIRGYRLDVFGGTGQKACKGFKNRFEIGACSPGSAKCPELTSPIP